jgi:CheY-like chemotaxis protein
VDLPVELAEPPTAQQVEQREVVGLVGGQRTYRILIAEDQRDSALLLQRLMGDIGLEAKVAENGQQCVQIFQEWHPDLIWMDRRMPIMEGPEAARRIRQLPDGGTVKIVAVTASAFNEQRQEMLDAGMNGFVSKPYRFGEIYDCLARQLGLKYIYRPEAAEPDTTAVAPMATALPTALDKQLRDALERLDSERIAALLDEVGAIDARLAAALSGLSKHFDYPAMVCLLDEIGSPGR